MSNQFDHTDDNDQAPKSKKKRRRKKNPVVQILKIVLILGIIVGLLGTIAVMGYSALVLKDVETIDASSINTLLGENSVIYDDKGNILETIQYDGYRKIVKYGDISQNVVNAYVAVEDKTFWEHEGFNYVRLIGSVWEGVTKGEKIRGTSTITQQLARNLYLAEIKSVRSLDRKIKEAYYANQLEKQLDKEQIMEAYLNTIYLGSGMYGIEAAAQKYFSKSAKDLDIVEAAMIVGGTSNPLTFAPLRTIKKADVTADDFIVDDSSETTTTIFNKGSEKRFKTVIMLIHANGVITDSEYEEYKNIDLKTKIKVGKLQKAEVTTYFGDMVKSDVIDALSEKYNISKEEAENFLFTKGLQIHSTLDFEIQKKLESAYNNIEKNKYLPKVKIRYDKNRNIVAENGTILLYNHKNLVTADEKLFIPKSDYEMNKNGDLVLYKGKRFHFYPNYDNEQLSNIQIVIKNSHKNTEGGNLAYVYAFTGHELAVGSEFKSFDESKNVIISRQFMEANPEVFTFDANNNILVGKDHYAIASKGVVQPQSAMVIMDYRTGQIKALIGGINVQGQKIYNRAINPRQPGSSIKPLAAYLPGIDTKKITAGTVFDDAPTYYGPGKARWPFNWYEDSGSKYWGLMTIREAVEWSNNVIAAKVVKTIGVDTSISYLKKLGISTIVDKGEQNDANLAAMSLGGMTKGITPLDITSAYGTIANGGVRMTPTTFTKVTDKNGKVLIEFQPEGTPVVDKRSAYIMTDIMRGGATHGIAATAAIRGGNTGIPVSGKTGTTSNQMDAWFVGYTPYYVGATWFGNDWNMPLNEGSKIAAKFWKQVMTDVHKGLPNKSFDAPEGISRVAIDTKSGKLPSALSKSDPRGTVKTEMFIPGTEPNGADDVHVSVKICKDSGKLATPNCPAASVTTKVMIQRKEPYDPAANQNIVLKDSQYDAPSAECDIHSGEVIDVGPGDPAAEQSGKQYIIPNGDGSYTVVSPFNVELNDGRAMTLPKGTQILSDMTISLPDGTILLSTDLTNNPNIQVLLGN